MKKKSLNIKFIVIVEIILAIVVFCTYKHIYNIETRRIAYAESSSRFVEENKDPIFRIGKIILYSSAHAIDKSDGQLKDIDISQFTDMEIYIDNTKKDANITAENTINEMYIDNIKVSTKNDIGTKAINYKNPFNCGKYTEIENYKDDGILFQISNTNTEDAGVDYNGNVFFTDCSNPISLGYVNKNLLTGCEVNSTNGSITFDGSILRSANVNLAEIKPTVSFTIHLTNNFNEDFECNVSFDVDLTDDNGGIYNGYIMKVLNTDNEKFNFLKISD